MSDVVLWEGYVLMETNASFSDPLILKSKPLRKFLFFANPMNYLLLQDPFKCSGRMHKMFSIYVSLQIEFFQMIHEVAYCEISFLRSFLF